MYASRGLVTVATMGMDTCLPVAFALDLMTVPVTHSTAHAAIGSGSKVRVERRIGLYGLLATWRHG